MDNTPDIVIAEETSVDQESAQMHLFAKLGAQILSQHYPNHVWMVGWAPGMCIVVKNMAIDDGRYGFTVDAGKAASISEYEHAVMIAGGELLERCGVTRGAWNGEIMSLQNKT